ncbi:hypothetical protein IQ241_06990 [Romeria aff. gracilis LEGE 07310]|uniref:DDE transposase family protein n=1 Tax=Vasconcelosia minhoensis LEGE 07310 TaxID=915328 RepID=A0A8J7DQS4_9CYAN|nr:hypothetical protein [Romeria gracilis]MBE9077044.1 hypothetical protein [Romeria aff. gracilis LEGE 07310]
MKNAEHAESSWYVVKAEDEQCQLLTQSQLDSLANAEKAESWGPFEDQAHAIAKRVGLIRAGKCKPA